MTFLLRSFFLIAVLTLGPAAAIAQVKVSGRCVDKKGKPIEWVNVSVLQPGRGEQVQTATDSLGFFSMTLWPGEAMIQYYYDAKNIIEDPFVIIPDQEEFVLETIQFNFQNLDLAYVRDERELLPGVTPLPPIDFGKMPLSRVEDYVKLVGLGVSSQNELTSNYNVRGGNYDENLVYVNGFLINRPFLTRSGQQEGMSFINTALVENVYFSSGGFQANYGDKLSSVLDIRYKKPAEFHASVMASLLGVEAHAEQAVGARFRYLFGARYRSNGYLLNSLPAKGNYNPVYWDGQLMTEFDLNENWKWVVLGHVSSNNYRFAPETQQTDFGTANEAYSFNIYFDGQEDTRFLTMTGGTAFKFDAGRKYTSSTYFTAFRTDERERFDIQGQYYINELETDPTKEEYGDSIAVLGVGTFLNHARNQLQATILSAYHDASYAFTKNSIFRYGFGVQYDQFSDVLSEWRMIDSAGYSQPQNGNDGTVDLFETIKGRLSLENVRSHAYVQQHLEWNGKRKERFMTQTIDSKGKKTDGKGFVISDTMRGFSKWEVDLGARALHTSYNGEFMVTPRFNVSFFPVRYVYHDSVFERRSMKLRFAAGAYYQPPFYREFRTFTGGLNPNVKAQKSLHFVFGGDYNFYMWGRSKPFKVSAEAYYKYLWDVNPYEIENVRTRYYADNIAKGYAYGFDAAMHGEFVPGIESFLKLGVLSTKEDVEGDYYWNYYNAAGERITPISEDQVVADSVKVEPGFIRRPSDQRLNMSILFQDNMPGLEQFTVQMGLNFGSRLPYGPPDFTRYKDTLTMKSYFRVDIGLSYDFLHHRERIKDKWYGKLNGAILSFEVFNLLGINNVLSKQWIQDIEGKYYSIPNYLTQRRFNLKMIIRI